MSPLGTHHDQSLGDLLGAAVAELPKSCPVIPLAVQVPILLVVLVGQGSPALAAPAPGDEDPLVTMTSSSPCPHCHPREHPVTINPTVLQPNCFPCFPPCCKDTTSVCHQPQGGSGWCGDTGVDKAGDTRQGQAWGGMCQPCMDMPPCSWTHGRTCQTGHRHATWHRHIERCATLVMDVSP